MSRSYSVAPHNPEWAQAFQREAERLRAILGPEVVVIQHFGSTAIPGIHAKPIIDVLVEVHDINRIDTYDPIMVEHGYQPRGEFGLARRRFFTKDAAGLRTHNVHIFQVGEARYELVLRDYLLAHPDDAQAYGRVKQDLYRQFPNDLDAYIAGKDAFVKALTLKAVAWKASQADRVERADIVNMLRMALEPLEYAHAMWEGGAAGFGRVDAWSDVDLHVVVDDDRVAEAFAVAEQALTLLTPIDVKYELPQPTWHGHAQAFYRFRRASEFLLLDLVIMKQSDPNRFIHVPIHGLRRLVFDKTGVAEPPPFDDGAHLKQIENRLNTLRTTFPLFQSLTLKELNRGNDLEALGFYHSFTLRPLVEVLRIQHCAARYNFHSRYIHYDLPAEVVQQLRPMFFVASADELRAQHAAAGELFYATMERIDLAEVGKQLRSGSLSPEGRGLG
jgi:GrpB-like predicted nucleotidyltransferase (UPF0157 family)